MDAQSAFTALADLIGAQFSVPVDLIAPDTRLADLALDSIGLVELAVLLEDEYDVDVMGAGITMDDSIGDLAERLTAAHPEPTGP